MVRRIRELSSFYKPRRRTFSKNQPTPPVVIVPNSDNTFANSDTTLANHFNFTDALVTVQSQIAGLEA